MDEYEEQLIQDFRGWGKVLNIGQFAEEINKTLKTQDFKKKNSRLVFSVCSDDCNRLSERETIEKALTKLFNREFHLGGLAGYPFGGISGITAASHHPPDCCSEDGDVEGSGNLIFFISPHVGLIKKGVFIYGNIFRPGQQRPTASCGAMMSFLNNLKKTSRIENFVIDMDEFYLDPERLILHKEFINNYSEELIDIIAINEINRQVIELFILNHNVIVNKLKQMIDVFLRREKYNFHSKIALITGITVNTPHRDYFILKEMK